MKIIYNFLIILSFLINIQINSAAEVDHSQSINHFSLSTYLKNHWNNTENILTAMKLYKVSPGYSPSHAVNVLHVAARNGDLLNLLEAIEFGVDPRLSDYSERTPLADAAENGHFDCVEYLLKETLAAQTIDHADINGDTALIKAARAGYLDVVKLLVNNGANIFLQNNNGDSALSEAIIMRYRNIVKYLASAYASTKSKAPKLLPKSI